MQQLGLLISFCFATKREDAWLRVQMSSKILLMCPRKENGEKTML